MQEYNEWTKQDQSESYEIGYLWELNQQEDQTTMARGCHGRSKEAERKN